MFRHRSTTPRLAMVTCVRNEERLLSTNLAYHHAIGVERAYVFLDRCTDRSQDILRSFPWVCAITINPSDASRFRYVGDLQRICMDTALSQARAEGMDWLFMVDVDEFAVAENRRPRFRRNQSAIDRTHLLPMLARQTRATEIVSLQVSELLPQIIEPDVPVWNQQYFLQDEQYERCAHDPTDGEMKSWSGNIGHSFGKCIVRTNADVQAFDPHFWTRQQGKTYPQQPGFSRLRTKIGGRLLHYVTTDYQQWRDKYQKLAHEPATWSTEANVSFPKQCWKEAAARMSNEEAREYYRNYVASTREQLDELVTCRVARKDGTVERVLLEAGAIDGNVYEGPNSEGECDTRTLVLPESYWADATDVGIERSQGQVRCRIADLHRDCLSGFRQTIYDRGGNYRLVAETAEVRIKIHPSDYDMTLHFHPHQTEEPTISAKVDGRLIPKQSLQRNQNSVTWEVDQSSFSEGQLHTITLQCAAESVKGRAKLTAITEISFAQRRANSAAVA